MGDDTDEGDGDRWGDGGSDGCPEDDDDFWYDDEDGAETGEEEFPVDDVEVEVEPCVEPVKVGCLGF